MNKKQRQELAARLEESARTGLAESRKHRAEAARLREEERTGIYKDPKAYNEFVGREEAEARIKASDARRMAKAAKDLRKPWWKS